LWSRSVAEQILRRSPIPVLTAVPRDCDEISCEPENVIQLWGR
jgi:hypothetical protein